MSESTTVGPVLASLESIEAGVREIAHMVARGDSCEVILDRIGEVKIALHQTGQAVLEKQFYRCADECLVESRKAESRQKMTDSIRAFVRLV